MLQQWFDPLKPPLSGQSLRGHGNRFQPNPTTLRLLEGAGSILGLPTVFPLGPSSFRGGVSTLGDEFHRPSTGSPL